MKKETTQIIEVLDQVKRILIQTTENPHIEEVLKKYNIPGWETPDSLKDFRLVNPKVNKQNYVEVLSGIEKEIQNREKLNIVGDRVLQLLRILKQLLPLII